MTRRTGIAILLMLLLLALPLAAADWKGRGWVEPDTARDREGWMYADADQSTGYGARQVYFNVYANQDDYSVNPNSATLGSAILPYPTRMFAILGVWKDCNKDGYIGQPEGLLQWYPSNLLTDTSACPVEPQSYLSSDAKLVHNDGAWVRELLMIAPHNETGVADRYFFNVDDPSARIWGDWNLPEDGPIPTCPLTPPPRGTLQSTGGFLRYADCHPSWRITGTVNQLDDLAGGGTGLAFDDQPRERPDKSASLLNQRNPYGTEGDASFATMWDCRSTIGVTDPTGQLAPVFGDDGRLDLVYQPSPGAPDTGGSLAGTINETEEGLAAARGVDDWTGSCNRVDDDGSNGDLYDWVEADHEGVVGPRKRTDFEFFYNPGIGSGCVLINRPVTCAPDATYLTGEGGMRCALLCPSLTQGGNVWWGNPSYTASRNPFVNRETLVPWGATYASFYAYVTPGAVAVPAGSATGTYGSDHCDGPAPKAGGLFECDGTKWYRGPNGEDISEYYNVRVGATYNLRDIDCYDHRPAAGVPGVLSMIGERTCVR